jgi:hypothetical protein
MYELFLLIALAITFICLISPRILVSIHKKNLILRDVSEWGYSTPKQYRYAKNTEVVLIADRFNVYKYKDTKWKVIERARHDYLLQNEDGVNLIVLQSEIKLK